MPLDNTAKISDIITALKDMQGINQKAELASVIGAPASASDNIVTQITKLQDAKDTLASKIGVENTMPVQEMADALVVGKKWASGNILEITGPTYSVTGLEFNPNVVLIFGDGTGLSSRFGEKYSATGSGGNYASFVIQTSSGSASLPYSGSSIILKNNGFDLTGFSYYTGPVLNNVKWMAFE